MNSFDKEIADFVIHFFNRSNDTLQVIIFISDDNLLKGAVFSILTWYLWFKVGQSDSEKRINLLSTLISIFFVMVVTLGLAGIAPFRIRPFLNPDFNFTSIVQKNEYLTNLSSFPSDHAALFIALSTGFLFVSRKIGLLAICYTCVFIFFPRLYLGYHYMSDLLAGALIGASITSFFNYSSAIKRMIIKWIIPFMNNYPWYFYAILFFVTYQIAELFTGSREILYFFRGLYKH